MTALDQRYAELEAAGDAKRAARMRRQPLLLIGLVNALVLGIGVTATVDLRRLQTPGGVALRWTQAAVFGDCDDYLAFSVAEAPETRPDTQLCRDLRASTKEARADNLRIGLVLGDVAESGDRATVAITLTRAEERTPLTLQLVRRDGEWRVLRDSTTCGSVGCA